MAGGSSTLHKESLLLAQEVEPALPFHHWETLSLTTGKRMTVLVTFKGGNSICTYNAKAEFTKCLSYWKCLSHLCHSSVPLSLSFLTFLHLPLWTSQQRITKKRDHDSLHLRQTTHIDMIQRSLRGWLMCEPGSSEKVVGLKANGESPVFLYWIPLWSRTLMTDWTSSSRNIQRRLLPWSPLKRWIPIHSGLTSAEWK